MFCLRTAFKECTFLWLSLSRTQGHAPFRYRTIEFVVFPPNHSNPTRPPTMGSPPERMSVYIPVRLESRLFSLFPLHLESNESACVCVCVRARACTPVYVCRLVVLVDRGACSSAPESGLLRSHFLATSSFWLPQPTLNLDSRGWSEWGSAQVHPWPECLTSVRT